MLTVSEPGALNFYTFFCPISLILSVSRNPILTHLPFSRFLDSLLCNLIAPTPGLVFFLVMPRTLAAASSFLSGRAYLSLNFLPPLFLRLTPTLICRGQHLSNQLLLSHFLLFTFPLLLLLLITRPLPRDGGMAEDHGAPEAGQLPRVWTRGHRETESRQRVSGAKSP